MRLLHLITLILLNSAVSAPLEFICSPEDPTDCYPKVFSPTEHWQVIKPNQDIPGGLHVRLNLDTLQREAKLMDPTDQQQEHPYSNVGDLVVSPEQQQDTNKDDKESNQAKVNAVKQKLMESKPKKLSPQEVNSFETSINELLHYPDGDLENLHQAIENLIELSHDMEFGTKLIADSQAVKKLQQISKNDSFKEKIYRIIASSFRNNPDSIQTFMSNDQIHGKDGIIDEWIKELDDNQSNDLITKRILGIFQGLIQDSQFKGQYLNELLDKFIITFPKWEESSKQRLINILEDLNLISEKDLEARSESLTSSLNNTLSSYLQHKLETLNFQSENQLKSYYNTLLELHDQDKSLMPSKSFIAWLDEEAGKRSQNIRPKDNLYSGQDEEFDKKLLETRHLVFGNPNGLRKHFQDEL